ncbi:MAG TPA: 3-isopropylmalate dehydrogenase [Gemmatimonadaceae bacterium]|nr:3-isopropylmalate dehydrogenase [Gemmatimonadaceae bacterium]
MRFTIACLPGDGIGPEVVGAAKLVLDAVGGAAGHDFVYQDALIGGASVDATGDPLPDETVRLCRRADAVLLGAVGGPRWDDPRARVRPEQGLLAIRRELGLFANLRPVAPHPRLASASPLKAELLRDVDFVVVRELTGGIYFGDKSRTETATDDVATDLCIYSASEIERVTRVACRLAESRRGKLTSVDKANVLETSRLWREVVTRVTRDEFPHLEVEHLLVDACAMHLVMRPATFDVIVTENMFGDILTDEASVLAGSIGVLPSASVGESRGGNLPKGLYEPIHGSAPTIAGKGIANPIGAILSGAMMLRISLGLDAEARAIERAVAETIDSGVATPDLAGGSGRQASTTDVAESVAQRVGAFLLPERVIV